MPPIPMHFVIAMELQILGSHGMQAYRYPVMMELIQGGALDPGKLIHCHITLEEAIPELTGMGSFNIPGINIINRF